MWQRDMGSFEFLVFSFELIEDSIQCKLGLHLMRQMCQKQLRMTDDRGLFRRGLTRDLYCIEIATKKLKRHKGAEAQRGKGTKAQRGKGTEGQRDRGTKEQRIIDYKKLKRDKEF